MEFWKVVEEFKNYKVSSLGNVVNMQTGVVRKLRKSKRGYLHITFKKNNKWVRRSVHRLVAIAFHGEIPQGFHVAHLDNNPSNNEYTNLLICTAAVNMSHKSTENRLSNFTVGEKNSNAKLSNEAVAFIRMHGDTMPHKELANMFGIKTKYVSDIKRGVWWKHLKGPEGPR